MTWNRNGVFQQTLLFLTLFVGLGVLFDLYSGSRINALEILIKVLIAGPLYYGFMQWFFPMNGGNGSEK